MKYLSDGWYGIISDDFTVRSVRVVTKAIAKYIKSHELNKKTVAVGYDTRFMSYKYAQIICEVLLGENIKCFISERDVPEVFVASCVKNLKCSCGIVISAGHMPYNYNAVKFLPDYAGPAFSHVSMEIERNIRLINDMEEEIVIKNYDQGLALSLIEAINMFSEYFKLLEKSVDMKKLRERDMKCVVDYMNGSLRGYLRKMSPDNIEWLEINTDYNPYFNGKKPDPEENDLEFLIETVKNSEADFGVAFDSNAQKIQFILKNGKVLKRNIIIGIVLEYILKYKNKNGVVVKSTSTSAVIDNICQNNGVEVIETYTEFKHISEKILKNNVIFAVDDSGGYTSSTHVPLKDSILLLFSVLEIICVTGKTIDQLIEEFIESYGNYYFKKNVIRVDNEDEKLRLISKIKTLPGFFNQEEVKDVLQTDGTKVIFNDNSWFLIKMDSIKPVFDIYMESGNPNFLQEIEKTIQKNLGE